DRDVFADRYHRADVSHLTFFEQLTVVGFMSFAEAAVDAAVIEVGIGGRLDATNVVDAEVAVVTGVALDHEDILGREVAEIAAEKAGIFKPGRWAVIGDGGLDEAVPLLVAAAEARGARPVRAGRDVPWPVRLPGTHQRANAACALRATALLGASEAAARLG